MIPTIGRPIKTKIIVVQVPLGIFQACEGPIGRNVQNIGPLCRVGWTRGTIATWNVDTGVFVGDVGLAGIIARTATLPKAADTRSCAEFGFGKHTMEAGYAFYQRRIIVYLNTKRADTARFGIFDIVEVILLTWDLDSGLDVIATMFDGILIRRLKGVANRLAAIKRTCRAIGDGRSTDHIIRH